MDKKASMADFAALLDGQLRNYRKGFNPGDTVMARVVRVGETHVTLDVNAKLVGLLPIEDVTDAGGDITVKRGDELDRGVVRLDAEGLLPLREGRRGRVRRHRGRGRDAAPRL